MLPHKRIAVAALTVALNACAVMQWPVLYPNAHLKDVGDATAQRINDPRDLPPPRHDPIAAKRALLDNANTNPALATNVSRLFGRQGRSEE